MEISQLYQDGRRYDAIFHGSHDVAFFREEIRNSGGPVLELCCGTGRLMLPLLVDGHECCGIDNSPAMIETAKRKIEDAGQHAELVVADAADFELGKRFQTAFIANNSIAHFMTIDQVLAMFERVRRSLLDNGLFIIDVFVPAIPLLISREEEKRNLEYTDPDNGKCCEILEAYQYDTAAQVKHAKWRIVSENVTIREENISFRMFFPQELDALLRLGGFEIVSKYGDYDRSAFKDGSPKQLVIARACP